MKDHPPPVDARAPAMDERVRSVADMGFTERQARFLVLVMRHAGVCIPRQYASFAGIANGGRKCNAFFARLVRRGLAAAIPCVHNRRSVGAPASAAGGQPVAAFAEATAGQGRARK